MKKVEYSQIVRRKPVKVKISSYSIKKGRTAQIKATGKGTYYIYVYARNEQLSRRIIAYQTKNPFPL